VSTKLLRLPTRGALGNGLRVVAGAVLASDGFLTIVTRGARLRLRPERYGATAVIERSASERTIGTRVEIGFGPDLPEDANALSWARDATHLARGSSYVGQSSPFWYDVPQFHELLSASGSASVRALIASLDGCAGGRAGDIVATAGLSRMACHDLDRTQAARLLEAARAAAKPVNPKRLGAIGPDAFPDRAYAIAFGVAAFGSPGHTEIPAVVEAWASGDDEESGITASVNRTPITGEMARRRASTRRAAWLKFAAPELSTPMACSASTKMVPNGSPRTRLTAFGFGPAICRKRPARRSKNARKENPSLAITPIDAPFEADGLSAINADKPP